MYAEQKLEDKEGPISYEQLISEATEEIRNRTNRIRAKTLLSQKKKTFDLNKKYLCN